MLMFLLVKYKCVFLGLFLIWAWFIIPVSTPDGPYPYTLKLCFSTAQHANWGGGGGAPPPPVCRMNSHKLLKSLLDFTCILPSCVQQAVVSVFVSAVILSCLHIVSRFIHVSFEREFCENDWPTWIRKCFYLKDGDKLLYQYFFFLFYCFPSVWFCVMCFSTCQRFTLYKETASCVLFSIKLMIN